MCNINSVSRFKMQCSVAKVEMQHKIFNMPTKWEFSTNLPKKCQQSGNSAQNYQHVNKVKMRRDLQTPCQ